MYVAEGDNIVRRFCLFMSSAALNHARQCASIAFDVLCAVVLAFPFTQVQERDTRYRTPTGRTCHCCQHSPSSRLSNKGLWRKSPLLCLGFPNWCAVSCLTGKSEVEGASCVSTISGKRPCKTSLLIRVSSVSAATALHQQS